MQLKVKASGGGFKVTGKVLIKRNGGKRLERIEARMSQNGKIVGLSFLGEVNGQWLSGLNQLQIKIGTMKFMLKWIKPLPTDTNPAPAPTATPVKTPTPAATPCTSCPFKIVSAKALGPPVLNGSAVPLEVTWQGGPVNFPITVLWNPAACPLGVACKAASRALASASYTFVLSDFVSCAGDTGQYTAPRSVGYYLKLRDNLNRETYSYTVYFECQPS
jgi:hypothetical protein